ncbi:hypothetical protein ACIRD2_02625 [Streptomyces sp. NPDC093595]|jgi:selenophosphate synthetase-related protein|uniref:hypothetical protein n=1 Tax=Streptomyces sp. NPDC093595 TaxID=3366045 RepID=UPI0038060B86
MSSTTFKAYPGVNLKKVTDAQDCDFAVQAERLAERLFAVQRELDATRAELRQEREAHAVTILASILEEEVLRAERDEARDVADMLTVALLSILP